MLMDKTSQMNQFTASEALSSGRIFGEAAGGGTIIDWSIRTGRSTSQYSARIMRDVLLILQTGRFQSNAFVQPSNPFTENRWCTAFALIVHQPPSWNRIRRSRRESMPFHAIGAMPDYMNGLLGGWKPPHFHEMGGTWCACLIAATPMPLRMSLQGIGRNPSEVRLITQERLERVVGPPSSPLPFKTIAATSLRLENITLLL